VFRTRANADSGEHIKNGNSTAITCILHSLTWCIFSSPLLITLNKSRRKEIRFLPNKKEGQCEDGATQLAG